ncbi:MAG: PKD-like domain-containing protein [Minisyncoccia bacterium]
MKQKITLLAMAILASISCNALNYYWVGGSGNWSDFGNHWSTTSGGIGGTFQNQWPQSTDNVFFDANSFTAPGQIVTLDQGITNCADLTWTTLPTTFPILYGDSSKTFRIMGSLTIATVIGFNFNGQVIMEANTIGKTITTGGTPINFHWTFNGAGGGWTFQDALIGSSVIDFINGNLNTNNQTINASAFYSTSGSARTLILGSSIFNLKGYNNGLWNINPIGMNLNAGTSTINGTSTIGSGGNFYGGGLTYYNMSFADSASIFGNNTIHDVAFVSDAFISGNNTFHDVSFFLHAIINGNSNFNNVIMSGNGSINGNNTFNNLTFTPWWTYTLQAGATQTIGNICAQGTGALPIRIQSSISGMPATILKASGSICWDYVRVSDITATGGATFNAGLAPANSQDLGGNTGLLFTGGCTALSCLSSCNPPSITTQPINSSVCLGSNAVFTITATGTDLTYQWQVNQGLGFVNLSNNIQYSGVTSNTLSISAPAILFNGYQYRCAAVGACPIVSMSNAATLTVKPSPTVTVNSVIICSGQTAILTASAGTVFVPVAPLLPPAPPLPPPPTTTSYLWSTGETTNPISIAPSTTTTYTVTGTTNGCSGTAIATATVNPMPVVSALVSSSTVTISATGGTPPYTGTGIFTGLAPGTYNYTVTDANGCAVNTTVIVTEPVNPIWSICANGVCCLGGYVCPPLVTVCAGTVINLSALNTFGAPYYFICPGGTYDQSNQTVVYTSSGSYNIELMDDLNSNHATGTIIVMPLPIVSATPSSQTICSGLPITTIAITSDVAGTTFSWVRDNITNLTGIASTGTGTSISGILTNTTPIQQVTTITITGTANGCVGTTVVTVTVNPKPTVGVANNSILTICSGTSTSISFGTSFNTGLTWTVSQSGVSGATSGFGSILSQTLTTTGTAIGTATYTVTPTANGCPGDPISVVVTVNPIPVVTATPSSQTICSGNSTGIALTSPVTGTTFSWTVTQTGVSGASANTGSTIAQTLTLTGTSAGTVIYTITPLANGCQGTPLTISITITPAPAPPAITGSANICSGSSYCVPPNYQTYSWSVNPVYAYSGILGATTNCANITWVPSGVPTTGAVVTIIATDVNGCSTTSSMNVYQSCHGNPSTLLFCNTSASQVWNDRTYYNSMSPGFVTGNANNITINTQFNCNSNSVLAIDGTFTIDADFNINSCNIILSPDAKIIVQAPRTLKIDYDSWLHACSNIMWDGIYVNAGAHLIVRRNSLIEDAKNAIVSIGGGEYTIITSIFNKNYKDIVVQAFTGSHPGKITNSIFTCRILQMCQQSQLPLPVPIVSSLIPSPSNTALALLPSASLLPPYAGQITRTGIEITDVNTITIDLPTTGINSGITSPTDYNAFDNMDIGIKSTNSNIIVKDNWFQYIIQPTPPVVAIPGCCIGTVFDPPTCAGDPACSPPPPPLKGVAIWAIGNPNTFVKSMQVGKLPTNTYAGDINNFTYCTLGIQAETNISATIVNNKMNNFVQKPNTASTGILVQNCFKTTASILNNDLKKFYTGIQCKFLTFVDLRVNSNKLSIAPAIAGRRGIVLQSVSPFCLFNCTTNIQEVATNTISNVSTGILIMQSLNVKVNAWNAVSYIPTFGGSKFGIRVQGSIGTIVDNNNVYRTGTNPTPAIVNTAYGISVETGSGSSRVTNNQLTRMGTGIRCLGNMPASTVTCNTIYKCYYGIGLYGATIGQQGNSTFPSDNAWTSGTFNTPTNPRIYSNLLGTASAWYYRSGSVYNVNPFTSTGIFGIPVSGNPASNCSPPCSPPCNQGALAPVVKNLLQYTGLVNENKWLAKKITFAQVKQDTTVLNQGTIDDSVFQSFYASMQTANIGQIVQINDLIAQRDLQNALALNDAYSPASLIESNWQETNRIYIRKLQNNDFALDTLERTTLWSIAPQDPMTGGDGVYLARILLDVNYDDLDPASRSMLIGSNESDDSTQSKEMNLFKLYPNPNDGNMMLDYSLNTSDKGEIAIFDIAGKLIYKYGLDASANQIIISHTGFNNGIYFYRIKINDQIVQSDKLIIIK